MKRALIALAVSIVLSAALITMGTGSVNAYVRMRLPEAEKALAMLEQGDFVGAAGVLNAMLEQWPGDRKNLAIFVDHHQLDDLFLEMTSAYYSCGQRNADAVSQCATLVALIRHFPDMNKLRIEVFL